MFFSIKALLHSREHNFVRMSGAIASMPKISSIWGLHWIFVEGEKLGNSNPRPSLETSTMPRYRLYFREVYIARP